MIAHKHSIGISVLLPGMILFPAMSISPANSDPGIKRLPYATIVVRDCDEALNSGHTLPRVSREFWHIAWMKTSVNCPKGAKENETASAFMHRCI